MSTTSPTTAAKLVQRRLAIQLLEQDFTQADTARCVGYSESSVKRWLKAYRTGGEAALAPKPNPGRSPRMTPEQQEQLVAILLAGPFSQGFDTDLWTCRRVAEVIHRQFGIEYHPDHVGRILHLLGFSPQKPQRRAAERDEAAIAEWREQAWPRIKKRPVAGELRSSFSTNRGSLCSR
jgi:transposase